MRDETLSDVKLLSIGIDPTTAVTAECCSCGCKITWVCPLPVPGSLTCNLCFQRAYDLVPSDVHMPMADDVASIYRDRWSGPASFKAAPDARLCRAEGDVDEGAMVVLDLQTGLAKAAKTAEPAAAAGADAKHGRASHPLLRVDLATGKVTRVAPDRDALSFALFATDEETLGDVGDASDRVMSGFRDRLEVNLRKGYERGLDVLRRFELDRVARFGCDGVLSRVEALACGPSDRRLAMQVARSCIRAHRIIDRLERCAVDEVTRAQPHSP